MTQVNTEFANEFKDEINNLMEKFSVVGKPQTYEETIDIVMNLGMLNMTHEQLMAKLEISTEEFNPDAMKYVFKLGLNQAKAQIKDIKKDIH